MHSPLFASFSCRALRLPNRIVMAPMTRKRSPKGIPGDDVAGYYRRRAEGGVGLIVTEGVGVDRPGARSDPDVPVMFGSALPAWERVVQEVHSARAAIAPQLWHVGARPDEQTGRLPLGRADSPSGLPWPGKTIGKPMSEGDIANTIEAFADAAANAAAIGFDAIELHGANGYLIDQFFWEATNRRTDRWNGGIRERSRFAAAMIGAIRARVGESLPIMIRLSQDKAPDGSIRLANSPEELAAWVEPLAEAGIDIFHCSGRRFGRAAFAGSDVSFAGWVKKLTGRPTIAVGSVGLEVENGPESYVRPVAPAALDEVEERLSAGEFDLVAVGRALLADPQWVHKIRAGHHEALKGFSAEVVRTLT